MIVQTILTVYTNISGSVLGGVLGWSVARVVRGIDIVCRRLYSPDGKSLKRQVRVGLVGLLAINMVITVMITAGIFVTLVRRLPLLLGVFTPVLLLYRSEDHRSLVVLHLPARPGHTPGNHPWDGYRCDRLGPPRPLSGIRGSLANCRYVRMVGSGTLVLLWMYIGAFMLLFGIVATVVLPDRFEATVDEPTLGWDLVQEREPPSIASLTNK